MNTNTKNIIDEIDVLPVDIKNIVMDYKERPITIGLSFDIEYKTIGQLFIDNVAEIDILSLLLDHFQQMMVIQQNIKIYLVFLILYL